MNWRLVSMWAFVMLGGSMAAHAQSVEVTSLKAGGQPLASSGGSGGQEATGGDLSITIRCDAAAYADRIDSAADLQMLLYVDGQLKASQWFHGYGTTTGTITATVRASVADRRIVCEAMGPFASQNSSTGTLLGSGPLNARLTMDAFIPYEWIKEPSDPADPFDEQVAGGDNRGFSVNGTSRLKIVANLLNPAVSNSLISGSPSYHAGQSTEYDAETSLTDYPNMGDLAPQGGYLTAAAKADTVPGGDKKLRWGPGGKAGTYCEAPERLGADSYNAVSRMKIYCEGTGTYPYHSLAPAIDWQYTVFLTFGKNEIAWTITGCRDGFPAYQAHLNNKKMLHHGDNGRPSSLFAPCEVQVNESGVIK